MRLAPVLLGCVLVVAGCGSTATAPPDAPTTTVTTTSTATVTTTATATPAAAVSAAAADVGLAARMAALACQSYVFAGTLDAATGSGPLDEAAGTATSAAVVDPAWTDLAGALAFVAALPLTDNTSADIDRSTTELAVIASRCSDAGVAVD